MPLTKVVDHFDNLSKWDLDERVSYRIKDSGFYPLLGITSGTKHYLALIEALLLSYSEPEGYFSFNGNKFYFGLEDVAHITGLPIDGKPVTGKDLDPLEVCLKYLGRDGCRKKSNAKGTEKVGNISLPWLRDTFMEVPLVWDRDSDELKPYVRAFLLYLIGSVVLPENSNKVSVVYLQLLEDLEDVKNYAWGAALLAHLHTGMQKWNNSPSTTSLMGHTFSLQIFAMLRIRKLVELIFFNGAPQPEEYPKEFPLLVGWTKILEKPSRNNHRRPKLQQYTEILDELQEHDIVSQPYKRLPCYFFPVHMAGQLRVGMSRTVLICFEKAVYHRPDLCPEQFGIQKVDLTSLRLQVTLEPTKGRTGPKGKNWEEIGFYESYKLEWDNRANSIIKDCVQHGPVSPHSSHVPVPHLGDTDMADVIQQENRELKLQVTELQKKLEEMKEDIDRKNERLAMLKELYAEKNWRKRFFNIIDR